MVLWRINKKQYYTPKVYSLNIYIIYIASVYSLKKTLSKKHNVFASSTMDSIELS